MSAARFHGVGPGGKDDMSYTHWIPGRRQRTVIDLKTMSYDAIAAVMNALNPSPGDFTCEGDRQAFSDASAEVARRWSSRRGPSVGLS